MNTLLDNGVDNRRKERLARLGILTEPLGYPDGVNRYELVDDDPVGLVDPMGLTPTTTIFAPWYNYIAKMWMGSDFAGIWHDLTVENDTGITSEDGKILYKSNDYLSGGNIILDSKYIASGVVKMPCVSSLPDEIWLQLQDRRPPKDH